MLLGLCGCTFLFFHPTDHISDRPKDLGLAFEAVRFSSSDGTALAGLWLRAEKPTTHGTVVHFHGNAGNLTTHIGYSYWLARQGFDVLLFDYRGYGDSGGRASQSGVVRDGVAALRYARSRPDALPDRTFVLGQSLGASVAVASVAAAGAVGVRAIALESPFSSYRSVARTKLAPLLRPLVSLLIADRHRPLEAVRRLPPVPILVIHGDDDPVVPYREGVALFLAAREPKELWTIPGAGHTEAFTRYGPEYRRRLVTFFLAALDGRETDDTENHEHTEDTKNR